MNSYFLIALGSLLIMTLGCQPKKVESKKQPLKKTFVHGDPKTLIAGASLDVKSFINQSNFQSFNNFDLTGGGFFIQKSELEKLEEGETIEDGNEADTGEGANQFFSYNFSDQGNGTFVYQSNDPEGVKLYFAKNAVGDLELTKYDQWDVTILHYSVNPELSNFSFLYELRDESNYMIIALNFTKNLNGSSLLPNVDPQFNYLLGPGIISAWSQEIRIDLCGPIAINEKNMIMTGIRAWATDVGKTKIGNIPLTIRELPVFKPFSDVNQHCMQVIDSFLFEDSEDFAVLGVAYPSVNKTNREIRHGHVFISKGGITKVRANAYEATFLSTVTHEFGHFIGLDHEFELPSIMGYDGVLFINQHDRQAVQNLYGGEFPLN